MQREELLRDCKRLHLFLPEKLIFITFIKFINEIFIRVLKFSE